MYFFTTSRNIHQTHSLIAADRINICFDYLDEVRRLSMRNEYDLKQNYPNLKQTNKSFLLYCLNKIKVVAIFATSIQFKRNKCSKANSRSIRISLELMAMHRLLLV